MKNTIILVVAVLFTAIGVFTSCEETNEVSKIKVESVILGSTELNMVKGETSKLNVKILPANAEVEKTRWSVDNNNVTVDEEGNITAKEVGTSIVTYNADDVFASCQVNILSDVILPETVKIIPASIEVNYEKYEQLDYGIMPKDATDKTVTWKSENENIVKVDQTGRIQGVGLGKANVTVTTTNGKVGKCEVAVIGKVVESLALMYSGMEFGIGDMDYQFIDEILPADASDKKINWSSTDEKVVKVEWDEEGQRALFTAVGVGKAYIWAVANSNPEVKESTWIEVSEPTGVPFSFGFDWILTDCKFKPEGKELLSEDNYLAYLTDEVGFNTNKANELIDLLERYISYKVNDSDAKDYLTMTVTEEDGTISTAQTTSFKQERKGFDVYNYNATYDFSNSSKYVQGMFSNQFYKFDGEEWNWNYEVKYEDYGVTVVYTFAASGKSILD